jgi:hypothetical protein
MKKTSFSTFVMINSVEVLISSKFTVRKRLAIKRWLHSQLKGLLDIEVKGMKCRRIFLEPFNAEQCDNYEIVPGAYKYYPEKKKLEVLRKKTSISIFEDEIYFGFSSIFDLSVHFLYFLSVIKSNKTLVHAAGFKFNGKNVLVPAFGGIGKTFLVSKLSQECSTAIYGDDLILLDDENYVYPYHRPMCIYKYHYDNYLRVRLARNYFYLRPSLPWRIALRLRIEMLDRFGIQIGNFDDYCAHSAGYVTTAVGDILDDTQIPKSGDLLDVIIVIKRTSDAKIKTREINCVKERRQLAKYIAAISHHEWSDYHRMCVAYQAFTNNSVADHFSTSELLINKAFNDTEKVFLLTLPTEAKDAEIEHSVKKLL